MKELIKRLREDIEALQERAAAINLRLASLEGKCSGITDTALGKDDTCHNDDPYLQPDWPCEVWDWKRSRSILRFYLRNSDDGTPEFQEIRGGLFSRSNWNNYYPLGTEWDFAPKWADRLVIEPLGSVTFYGGMIESQTVRVKTVLPEEYWGKTIPRPEWAKGGR
jgi:hypothetical protein